MRGDGVGEGEGKLRVFIVGGCLCSSLRRRIALRDCAVLDHPLAGAPLGSYDRLMSAVRIKSCCDIRVGLGGVVLNSWG